MIPGAVKIPWRRKWQPTPVSLPAISHGQRSPAGYSPWVTRVGHDLVTKPPLLNEYSYFTTENWEAFVVQPV